MSKGLLTGLEPLLLKSPGCGGSGRFRCDAAFPGTVEVSQSALKPFKSKLPVFSLELVVRSDDCYPGWFVEQPDGAFDFVPVLPTWPASPERVDLNFSGQRLEVCIVSRHRIVRAPWSAGREDPCRRRILEEARFPEGIGHRTFGFTLCGM